VTARPRLDPDARLDRPPIQRPLTAQAALELFDSRFQAFEPDPALLSGSPARTLVESMQRVVTALTRIDVERVRRRQSWWHVFSGADLEARLELEVAVHGLRADMQKLAEAASAAARAAKAMRDDLPRLDAAQQAHAALIEEAHLWTAQLDVAGDPTAGRLQRRLGNLEALYASNRLTRAQIALAIDHLEGMLDRYRDIKQLLFPLWQQHALAVAQSSGPVAGRAGAVDQLRSVHERLRQALSTPKESTP